ncbi:MAG: carboxypeptidase regulatory-like domain-containing protein [Planctomycetota bacterium]
MKKLILLVGALGVVALVLVLAFTGNPPEGNGPVIEELASTGGDGRSRDEPEAAGEEPGMSREVVAEAAEAPDPDAPPDSYTRALGGLVGRIVEPDGTPVPDMGIEALAATVHDFFPDLGSLFNEEPTEINVVKGVARSDENGRFRFEKLEPRGIYVLGIDSGGARSTIRFVDHAPNPGEVVDLGDVALDPYVIFTGRVVDEDGAPVADARVRATNLPSVIFTFGVQDVRPGFTVAYQEDVNNKWRVAPIPPWITRLVDRFPVPTTRTEEDGTFRLEGVPLGMATVLVDKEDLLSLVHGPVPTGNTGEKTIGDLRMQTGETLVGRVIDSADVPVPNAEILAGAQLELAPAAVLAPVAVSDEAGRFEVAGLSDSDHVVAARPEGGIEWTIVTDVAPGYDEAVIRIGGTHSLTVITLNAFGEVLGRPAVAVQPINRIPLHPLLVPSVSMDRRLSYREDGAAVVKELDPGKYAVTVKAPGYTIGSSNVDLTDGPAQVEMVLIEEVSVTVQVVEAATGDPVHYATVGVFDPSAKEEMKRVPLSTKRTGPEGTVRLDGLKNGTYRVAVIHPAYATAEEEMIVPGEVAVIELRGGGTLQGRVHMGNNPPDKERFVAMGVRGKERFPRFTVTDANGEFEVTHLEPGEYSVTIMQRFANQSLSDQISGFEQFMPERFMEATIVEGELTYLDVDILGAGVDGPTARVRGRVHLNSAPGADMTVSARPRGEWRGQKSARTDENGFFDFGEVPAGKVTVSVRQKGRADAFMSSRLVEQNVDLEPNETREVNFDIRTGALRGRAMLDSKRTPAPGAQINLRSEGGDEWEGTRMDTVAGRDGSFFFPTVPAGTYRVRARRDGYAEAVAGGVKISYNGEPPPVELVLYKGVEIRGIIELPSGMEKPRFLWLDFRSKVQDGERAGGRVDTDSMQFHVAGLKPGLYEVQLHSRQAFELMEVTVPVGGMEGLVLRPQLKQQQEGGG